LIFEKITIKYIFLPVKINKAMVYFGQCLEKIYGLLNSSLSSGKVFNFLNTLDGNKTFFYFVNTGEIVFIHF
jgi:hypothetical protein